RRSRLDHDATQLLAYDFRVLLSLPHQRDSCYDDIHISISDGLHNHGDFFYFSTSFFALSYVKTLSKQLSTELCYTINWNELNGDMGSGHLRKKEVRPVTVFEALSVMFLFGMFILALLTYIHTCKKK
ncbi:putative holin-like toxin, partial [Paenibacillus alvei]